MPDADTRDGECITIRQRPCTYCTRCAERHDVDVPLWVQGILDASGGSKAVSFYTNKLIPLYFPLGFNSLLILGLIQELVVVLFTRLKSGLKLARGLFFVYPLLFIILTNECFGVTRL